MPGTTSASPQPVPFSGADSQMAGPYHVGARL